MEYRQHLLGIYLGRREKNPRYSLRAFARDLGVSHTSVTELLSFRRHLSKQNRLKISKALCLSPAEEKRFCRTVSRTKHQPLSKVSLIEEDRFRLIGDWYHFAILSVAKLKTNRADPKWIAERLGIDTAVARMALERLNRMGLVKTQRGKLFRTCEALTTSENVPSAPIRRFHRQALDLASNSLDRVSVEKRDFSVLTFTGDPRNIKRCRKLIRKFKKDISELMGTTKSNQVYHLGIQLYPLLKEEN